VKFYDVAGNRLSGRSTGQASKSTAETWAIEQTKKGVISAQKNITFGKYAQGWWIWEKWRNLKFASCLIITILFSTKYAIMFAHLGRHHYKKPQGGTKCYLLRSSMRKQEAQKSELREEPNGNTQKE
jgi:hypothetical protein